MLSAEIKEIEAYTAKHASLQQAHHWLFDLKSPPDSIPEVALVGINPGEWPGDWEICPHPTEETSRFDFHDAYGNGRAAIPWTQLCNRYLGNRPFVQTELFFWSSSNLKQLEERYGRLRHSPHLGFCRDMNQRLFDAYDVKAVVSPGINNDEICSSLYGLGPLQQEVRVQDVRIAKLYHDGRRPWVFTKHWTGAFGFTRAQKDGVKSVLEEVLAVSSRKG